MRKSTPSLSLEQDFICQVVIPVKSEFKMENVIQTNYGSCNWELL